MKRALSDVLWDAANEYLPAQFSLASMNLWSCNAALSAEGLLTEDLFQQGERVTSALRKVSKTDAFLRSLGCDTSDGFGFFMDYPCGPSRQGARYMWLLLAMHVAEDEGIQIEVAA